MTKTAKRLLCLMTAFLMLALPVFAADPADPLLIHSEAEFLTFAAACREDNYSKKHHCISGGRSE
ncbi:secreted protein, partial [gut metagenome]